jgi:hypothetical protein
VTGSKKRVESLFQFCTTRSYIVRSKVKGLEKSLNEVEAALGSLEGRSEEVGQYAPDGGVQYRNQTPLANPLQRYVSALWRSDHFSDPVPRTSPSTSTIQTLSYPPSHQTSPRSRRWISVLTMRIGRTGN